ncbi:ABC transporter ATP-binding protein [Calderihabitans maritimus]|uniref:ABC transporter ATP-binding protein n=1 Tax=Calderihabitans maritimus TaxID=1246530 RepID=A0A1Z5HQS1_9FIRM|nr:ABC transporter ATP-binding protein [Calderihabitans maritimus]GAW91876.1 ABC transporter ATP-binding protein [Calderihabitans maritimus]
MLKVENLRKNYGKFQALKDLTFSVSEGSIYGFVGPNGAGKSTTIKILATLLQPTAGEAYVAGVNVVTYPERVRELIGYMPDFFGVYDDLKVSEYLDFYAASYGIGRAKRRKICDDLLELVELSHKREAYVNSLSRGMKQRLCLARCLVHDPQVLLLDEPASGLDPRARLEMRELLKELQKMGKTILISSHILPELAEMCTEVGIIEGGRMVISGRVDTIMQQLQFSRVVKVTVLDRAEEAAALMEAMDWLGEVAVEGNVLQARLLGGPEHLRDTLRELVKKDIPVISFHENSHNLEDIFLQVTEGVEE